MKLTLVIQAGGASQRMGQDKALLEFRGRPLIQHVCNRLAAIADQNLITANHGGYDFLGLPIIADIFPNRGALGGLYTALAAAMHPLVAIVACDMPFASPGLFTHLRQLLNDDSSAAAIPFSADGLEPFHAIYRKSACMPSLRAALDAGDWRIRTWLASLHLRLLTSDEIMPFDPDGRAFVNLNTPGDLAAAQAG